MSLIFNLAQADENTDPIAMPSEMSRPMPVLKYDLIPNLPLKAMGYSLLETGLQVTASSKASAALSARAESEVSARSQSRSWSRARVSEHMSVLVQHRSRMGDDPPEFYKQNSMAPGKLSPFIAADLWNFDTGSFQLVVVLIYLVFSQRPSCGSVSNLPAPKYQLHDGCTQQRP